MPMIYILHDTLPSSNVFTNHHDYYSFILFKKVLLVAQLLSKALTTQIQ